MKKRLLASFLMGITLLTSIHTKAYALADTYNANNYIVDKAEQYGGSHLVITNTSTSEEQAVGTWPSGNDIGNEVSTMGTTADGSGIAENIYGFDSLGQALVDPSAFLGDVGEDMSAGSSQENGAMENVSLASYAIGTTKTLYLKNQNNDGTYPTECICVAIGEHCTVWIPVDDPYYVACMEAVAEESVLTVEQGVGDTISGNTISKNTVSENSVSGNEVSQNDISGNALSDEVEYGNVETDSVVYSDTTSESENAMVEAMEILAGEFDEKYDAMVNMFGDSSAADASNRGDADGKTAIICYDIFGDYTKGSSGGYVAGYFWGADLKGYGNSTGNAMDCIHVDSYQGMGRLSDFSINTDYISNCYSTLVHEFQHMIHYSNLSKNSLSANYTPTYLNETFSAAAEYLMYGHNYVRTSYFNTYDDFQNGMSLTQWDTNGKNWAHGTLMNYSVAYMFSQYIRAQYKGVVDETGSTIYKDAMKELTSGKDLLDIIARKIGTTKEDIWLNFRAALELKNETGPYGFAGDEDFTYYINSSEYTGSMDGITLAPGGSLVVPIDESYTPPADAGSNLKYLGIDLEKTEKDIVISFVTEEGSAIDTFGGKLELKANVSPYYMSQDVTFSIVSGEEYATLSDNVLTASQNGVVTVRATWNEKEEVFAEHDITIEGQEKSPVTVTEINSGNRKLFKTINDAASGLDFVAQKAEGTYVFTLKNNDVLTEDIALPSYVTEAVFVSGVYEPEEEAIEQAVESQLFVGLDLNGYQITASGKVTWEEGIALTNSSEEQKSVINIDKSNAAEWNTEAGLVLKAADGSVSFVDINGQTVTEEERAIWLDNVEISAPGTAVELQRGTDNTIPYTINTDIDAQLLRVPEMTDESQEASDSVWTVGGTVSVEILDMQEEGKTSLFMEELSAATGLKAGDGDVLYADNVSKIKDLQLLSGAALVTDRFSQISSGKTYLWADSEWIINESAAIYNLVLSSDNTEEENKVRLYKTADADIEIEGTVALEDEGVKLSFAKLGSRAEDVNSLILQDYAGQTKLFDTSNDAFPVEIVCVEQATPDSASRCNIVYKSGNSVYVGEEAIVVKKVEEVQEIVLESFVKWEDAASYLKTLAGTQAEYVIEFSDSMVLNEPLTLPKNISGITFRGVNPLTDRITLTYTGDIKLVSNTSFENIDLTARKYNSKTKVYDVYESVVTLNGKTLIMKNTSAAFASVKGNSKSKMKLEHSKVEVSGVVTSLGHLDMAGSAEIAQDGSALADTMLSAESLAVTATLSMQSAVIDCDKKITLKDVITNDSYNVLSYGGNTSKNGLTINGTVSAIDENGLSDADIIIERTENGEAISKTAIARKNAISLNVKSMEATGYISGALLCNAQKAGAGWFVVGSAWNTADGKNMRSVLYATNKKGKAIHCGEITENVKLYSSNTANGNYAYESGFATLQDAFTEIDRLAVKTAYYRVELLNAEENVVTQSNKTPKFPSKTAGITIVPGKELVTPNIYFKGNLSLKSDVVLEDIVLVPQTKCTVALGNYTLRMVRCHVDTSRNVAGISGITGANVNGSSALVLDDASLCVSGNVNKVGTVIFTGDQEAEVSLFALGRGMPAYPTLTVNGTVNIGSIGLEKDGYLTGLATVTRKNGKVTKITPKLTINKEVYSANNATLYLDLQEKKAKEFVEIIFDSNEMSEVAKNGIIFAKAARVTYPNIKAAQRNESISLIKAGSYLAYYEDGFGAMLSYTEGTSGEIVEIPCRTFADAVLEINSQKTKRDYTITLFEEITEFSGADGNGKVVPKVLTMPNKKYVETLTIQADEETKETVKLGFLKNITLTSDVVLKNVNFVQLLKSGTRYLPADYVKDDYPAVLTWNAAGYDIVLEGDNTFNTPIKLTGANKSALMFDENGTITTLTNDFERNRESLVAENVIYGMITGFKTVTVDDCNLILHDYKSSRTATKYTESKNKITTVNVWGTLAENEGEFKRSGNIKVISNNKKAEFTCTNYNSDNGSLLTDGKVSLKNVLLEGDLGPTIHADTAFTVTGTLTSATDYALLETRLKGKGKEPYLNVSGKVVRKNNAEPIWVGVYPELTALNNNIPVDFKNSEKTSSQLLSAKYALSRDFRPIEGNYSGGEYSVEEPVNTSGYIMKKSSGKIYVCRPDKVSLAVYKGEYTGAATSELLGYYESFKDATTEVNALKNKTQDYSYVLTGQNGTMKAPVAISLPSQAAGVVVTGLADNAENEKIYFSGNITLPCNTVVQNIEFAPVKKGKGSAFSFSIGGFDLWLKDITISDESDKMTLKNITGNGKPTVVLDSEGLEISGAITKVAQIEVLKDTIVGGEYLTGAE